MFFRATLLFISAVMLASEAVEPVVERGDPPKVDPEQYRACGVSCLYEICRILGVETTLVQVQELVGAKEDGSATFADLHAAARELGYSPVAIKLSVEEISKVPAPAILHVRQVVGQPEGTHFAVYLGETRRKDVVLLSAPAVPEAMPRSRFKKLWTGDVLITCKTEAEAQSVRASLGTGMRAWWGESMFWTACLLATLLLWSASRMIARPELGRRDKVK